MLADKDKMEVIEAWVDHLHLEVEINLTQDENGQFKTQEHQAAKTLILQYPVGEHPAELLVDYFLIKERFCDEAQWEEKGYARSRRKITRKQPDVMPQIQAIFGEKFCRVCDGFKQELLKEKTPVNARE